MTITIREALQLPDMVQSRLVAGASGLDNPIRWVTIVEVLEDASRLQEGEFLITTGFGLTEDQRKLEQFIPTLAERKLSGVALHTGFYLREIPSSLIETANTYCLPLIEIPSEMNFSTVTKAILQPIINRQFDTLAYSEAIHQRMIEAALTKGGLQAIADELVNLTGGTAEIIDSFGYQAVRADRSNNIKDGHLITHTVSIRASRDTYGKLSLTKSAEQWKELDHVAVQHAATLCALEYIKERAIAATEWRLQGDFAEEILAGRITIGSETEARSRMLGYPLAGSHMVAALQISGQAPADLPDNHQKLTTLLKRLAERKNLSYLLRERQYHLLLIVPAGKDSSLLLSGLTAEWAKIYPSLELRTALSNPHSRLQALPEAAQEALFALTAYPLLAKPPTVLCYGDMQGYQFLYPYHHDQECLNQLWQPLLATLISYDDKHGQQLLQTLDAYFLHNLNGLQAAQALFIHRHTLKYRLQQIEEKTKCSLQDAAERWQLQLALMAYRLHRLLYR